MQLKQVLQLLLLYHKQPYQSTLIPQSVPKVRLQLLTMNAKLMVNATTCTGVSLLTQIIADSFMMMLTTITVTRDTSLLVLNNVVTLLFLGATSRKTSKM